MGSGDAQYERKKEKTHRRMKRLGRVIRLEGRQFAVRSLRPGAPAREGRLSDRERSRPAVGRKLTVPVAAAGIRRPENAGPARRRMPAVGGSLTGLRDGLERTR